MRQIIDVSDGIVTYSDTTDDGNITVGEYYDCGPLLDRNAQLRSDEPAKSSDIRPVASIPITLIRQWVQEDGINEMLFWQWPKAEMRRYCAKRL